MISVPLAVQGLLFAQQTLRLVVCWRLQRVDGVELRFTSASEELVLADGLTYTPAEAVRTTAWQKQADGDEHNVEGVGVITDDAIKDADLFAGRYEDMKVTEYVVDWKYPWAGNIATAVYWMAGLSFDSEVWSGQALGLTERMDRNQGKLYGRNCGHELYDDRCQVVKADFTFSGTVTLVTDDRRDFGCALGQATDFYTKGTVEWLTGANAGVISDVKSSTLAGGGNTIVLQLETPYPIEVGDTFDASAGCDWKHATCKDKFGNIVNHGGFSFIPGTDRILKTP